ncbi:MAG: lysoplasmalogenase [Wenzhouxiangella sp.]
MSAHTLHPSARPLTYAEQRVLIVCIALAAAYWLSLWGPDYPGHWLLKASPMLLAAGTVLRGLAPRFGIPMAVGFVAAAGGDSFLALDRSGFLMQALLCFLVTQVAYIVAFSGQSRPLGQRWKWWLPAVLYGGALYWVMLPGLGDFLLPVLVYVTLLVKMVIAASLVEHRPGLLLVGAALFLVADSLIGINRFVAPFPAAEPIIVAIYTTGQLIILAGALKALPGRPGKPG